MGEDTTTKNMVPELRFPEFHGEWEEKKLGEVAEIVMGQSPKSEFYNENFEGIPLIQGNNDIKNGETVSRVWTTHITKEVSKETLLMTVRAPVGKIGISTEKVCLGEEYVELIV